MNEKQKEGLARLCDSLFVAATIGFMAGAVREILGWQQLACLVILAIGSLVAAVLRSISRCARFRRFPDTDYPLAGAAASEYS